MNEKQEKWVDAVKQIHMDPKAKIVCPECNKGLLILKIVPFANEGEDWYFICDNCGKHNVSAKLHNG
jgi:hypothetical protein